MKSYQRLKSSKDFLRLREEGQRYRGNGLSISVSPNQLATNRYGFVTPKHSGNAVSRNRIRRRLRAIIDQKQSSLLQGHDVVVIVTQSATLQPFAELQRNIDKLLSRAGLV